MLLLLSGPTGGNRGEPAVSVKFLCGVVLIEARFWGAAVHRAGTRARSTCAAAPPRAQGVRTGCQCVCCAMCSCGRGAVA